MTLSVENTKNFMHNKQDNRNKKSTLEPRNKHTKVTGNKSTHKIKSISLY